MKIGLFAMSGVRVVNPRLLEVGVTLPGFVNRGEVIASLPSLGLIVLAAVTPPGHDVEYIEVPDVDEAIANLRGDFDLVAISSFTAMAYDMYRLADAFRALGTPVVLGGLHASFTPAESKEHADAVCIGEGETVWPRIVDDVARGGREGLQPFYREPHPGTYDLGSSPMPRFDLLRDRPYNRITVQTVRGCPLDCEFCGASKLFGPKYRRKPVTHVIAELERIKEMWGDDAFVEFADDNSFAHPQWTLELLEAMKDLDLRWFTETDLSIAENEAALPLLFESGCRQILIGLESVNESSLDTIDRANWKLKRRRTYADAIKKIQDHGVTVNGCFILGNDSDDKGVFEATRDFVEESRLIETQLTILTPFPGTRLHQRLSDQGRLLYDRIWNRCTLFDVTYQPANMTPDELAEGHIWLSSEVYNEGAFQRRKRHYVDIMKRVLPEGAPLPS